MESHLKESVEFAPQYISFHKTAKDEYFFTD